MEKRLELSFRNKTREAKDSIKVVMSGENIGGNAIEIKPVKNYFSLPLPT